MRTSGSSGTGRLNPDFLLNGSFRLVTTLGDESYLASLNSLGLRLYKFVLGNDGVTLLTVPSRGDRSCRMSRKLSTSQHFCTILAACWSRSLSVCFRWNLSALCRFEITSSFSFNLAIKLCKTCDISFLRSLLLIKTAKSQKGSSLKNVTLLWTQGSWSF